MKAISIDGPAHSTLLALVSLVLLASPVPGQEPGNARDPAATTDSTSDGVIREGTDYRIYDRWGNPTSLLAVVGSSVADEVLLVGEEHDDMVGHELEDMLLETVVKEVGTSDSGRTVVLSMEMFERDVQYIVDEYLAGLISEDHFLRSARPWDDYGSRYRALVERAKAEGLPLVASNAPRRYVSRVTAHGPGSLLELSSEARRFLPPLPYPGPSELYREQWDAVMEAATEGHGDEGGGGYAADPNVIYSQALWDASMAHAITQALVRHMDGLVVHFAGSFHVERGTGIPERIADYRPGTRVTTVVMTKVDDVDAWSAEEHGALADFVVLTKRSEETPGS